IKATSSSSEKTFSSTCGFSPLGCSLLPCSSLGNEVLWRMRDGLA
ncbi:hypothetical protein M5D96_002787, partial [Drosophila gunungcola]